MGRSIRIGKYVHRHPQFPYRALLECLYMGGERSSE